MAAIPTTYEGVRFRSRLEARWAAFFDALDIRWEYEPLDLDGYIPDFLLPSGVGLLRRVVLVEVKPIVQWPCPVYDCNSCNDIPRDAYDEAVRKIAGSGWDGEAVLVGASPLHDKHGWLGWGRHVGATENVLGSLFDLPGHDRTLTQLWREAGNVVQWRAA
jgi:hypothetical protein